MEPFIEQRGELRRLWLRKPRAIGERILIVRKGYSVPRPPPNRKIILLDVRGAFGTGGHGTTEGCLIALELHVAGGKTVLDVGTGTGILAIAAGKLGAGRVTAIDIDVAACKEAMGNISLNGLEKKIDVVAGDITCVRDPFDLVVANLRTPLLMELLDELVKKMKHRGIAILSGIMEREVHSFLSFLEPYPLEILEIKRFRGWLTLVLSGLPEDLLPDGTRGVDPDGDPEKTVMR